MKKNLPTKKRKASVNLKLAPRHDYTRLLKKSRVSKKSGAQNVFEWLDLDVKAIYKL